MSQKIEVSVDEVKRVFELLGEVNALFHQPLKYEDPNVVRAFSENNNDEICELYYNVVWGWLPETMKAEIEDE